MASAEALEGLDRVLLGGRADVAALGVENDRDARVFLVDVGDQVKDSYIGLKREEKDGNSSVFLKLRNSQYLSDSTAYQIFMLSDNNTTEGIIEEMQKRYPKISRKRLEKDVTDILWYLYNIGIVTKPDVIKEKSLTNYNPNKLCILDESDYLPAYNYVQKYN